MGEAPPQPAPPLARLKGLLLGSRQGIADSAISMVPQGTRVLTGIVGSVLMVRGLGPTGLGQFTLVMSLAESAAQLSELGIGQTAIRYASRAVGVGDEGGQMAVLRWAFRLRLALVALVTLLFWWLAPVLADRLWHVPGLTPLIRLGLLFGVFNALTAVPILYFQSLKRFGMNAAVLTGQALISFSGILLLAWLQRWTVASVLTVMLLASGIAALAFLMLVHRAALWARWGEFAPHTFWRSPATHLPAAPTERASAEGFAFYMLLSTVIVMLMLRMDVWLMGIFLEEEQIGLYGAALRLALPLTIVLNGVTTALWPRASALTSVSGALALLGKTFRLSALVAVGALGYALLAPLLAPWLFGAEYGGIVLLGQLICLRYVISILANPAAVVGYTFGMVRLYWLVNLLQLGLVVGVNLLLLPRVGVLAPAIALLVMDGVGASLVSLLLWRQVRQSQATNTLPTLAP